MNHSNLTNQGAQQNIILDEVTSKEKALWQMPFLKIEGVNFRHVKSSNRYNKHQLRRLKQLIKIGQIAKAVRIYSALVNRSSSLKVYWFNKVARGWYFSTELKAVQECFEKFCKLCRTHDANPVVKRSYIPKSNGRLRPIGSPTLEWRVYLAMWEGFLRLCLERTIPEWQHGFMRGRSGLTAWKMIWEKRVKYKFAFEFDLESCFNLLKSEHITEVLEDAKIPSELRWFIERINLMYPLINIKELLPEKELEVSRESLMKKGMTQGNPWSPLLAILLIGLKMERLGIDLVMYADDGILFTNNLDDIKKLQDKSLIQSGIKLSSKVTENGESVNRLVTGRMKFVGLVYHWTLDMIWIKDRWYPRKRVSDLMLKKMVWNTYENQTKPWNWNINKGSWTARRIINISKLDNWYKYISDINMGRRNTLMRYNQYIFDYSSLSTRACEWLLFIAPQYNKRLHNLNLFKEIYSEPRVWSYFRNDIHLSTFGIQEVYKWKEYYKYGIPALEKRINLYRKYFYDPDSEIKYLKSSDWLDR
jgi:hypothetical protein